MTLVPPPLLFTLKASPPLTAQDLDDSFAERFGRLALDCVHREYPNKIARVLSSDACEASSPSH